MTVERQDGSALERIAEIREQFSGMSDDDYPRVQVKLIRFMSSSPECARSELR